MPSLRERAGCVGVSGNFSVLQDFFGFFFNQLPADPTGAVVEVSLQRQFTRLSGDYYNLNVIRIGSDNFSDTDNGAIDYGIFKLRNVYNQVGVGVGRILHYGVLSADSMGLDTATSDDDPEAITDAWSVDNDGIDLFFPDVMNISTNGGNLLGRSAVDGPCADGKDDKGMTGSVCGMWASEQLARTMAHELGHYLSLEHRNSDGDNLMCQSGQANSTRNSIELTTGQGNDIKGHCIVDSGC
jgi:hypothetical protein